jgi:hypothetical protein
VEGDRFRYHGVRGRIILTFVVSVWTGLNWFGIWFTVNRFADGHEHLRSGGNIYCPVSPIQTCLCVAEVTKRVEKRNFHVIRKLRCGEGNDLLYIKNRDIFVMLCLGVAIRHLYNWYLSQ